MKGIQNIAIFRKVTYLTDIQRFFKRNDLNMALVNNIETYILKIQMDNTNYVNNITSRWYTREYYSAIKKNGILPWLNHEGIMLSEISRSEKDTRPHDLLIRGI